MDDVDSDDWRPGPWPDNDVRLAVAELIGSDKEPRIEDVPWGDFSHAYGTADDIPELLRGLSNPDPEQARSTLDTLWNNVRHQGGSTTAAALAVPFLIRTAADPSVHQRGQILLLAAEAGRRNHYGQDSRHDLLRAADPDDDVMYDPAGYIGGWSVQAARHALAADAKLLASLLEDNQSEVRCAAAYALAAAACPMPEADQALRARLPTESDPAVRTSLILAIAQLGCEHANPHAIAAWTEELWSDADNPPDVRLGAAIGWLCATTAPPPPMLIQILASTTEHTAEVMNRVPWPDDIDRHGGLGAWLGNLLDDPDAQAIFTQTRTSSAGSPAPP